jgi:hypothetical protein
MNELVTYYVKSDWSPGPAGLCRRRPDVADGARVDERFDPRDGTWSRTNELRKYESPRHDDDWDFYGVHPDESEQVVAWLRRVAEVGRDEAGRPPVLGEWSLGSAWWVELRGPLSEETFGTVLARLAMTPRAPGISSWSDLALRVLRSDTECRWNFTFGSTSDNEWYLHLEYLRVTPDERVIQGLRDDVYPVVDELGLDVVEESLGSVESLPLSERAAKQPRPDKDWLLAVWFRGQLTDDARQALTQRLRLTYDSTFSEQLRLHRSCPDEDRWRFEIGFEGRFPRAEVIDRWRADIVAMATGVGLEYEHAWLKPMRRMFELYRAYLAPRLTFETRRQLCETLGIKRFGRAANDEETDFGTRVLRAETNRTVLLSLKRTLDHDWYLSLAYQDTPPDQATLDKIGRDIRTAAAQTGLTVKQEPPPAPPDLAR